MNPVLERILQTRSVSDGREVFSLAQNINPNDGVFLHEIIRDVKPRRSLEVGFAYGVSTLYICDALAANRRPASHIVMDPLQTTRYRGIGLRHVAEAGYANLIEFHQERSEFLLPRLYADGVSIDVALVDGWHTFDQVMIEFLYIDRLLRVGGVLAFDDATRPDINRVIRYALSSAAYEVYDARRGGPNRVTWRGRIRRSLRRLPRAKWIFRDDLLYRDWDLGVFARFVALKKVADGPTAAWWREVLADEASSGSATRIAASSARLREQRGPVDDDV